MSVTKKRPGGHQTAHPADLLFIQTEPVLRRSRLEERPSRAGPSYAGSHDEVTESRREGSKVLRSISVRRAAPAGHGHRIACNTRGERDLTELSLPIAT